MKGKRIISGIVVEDDNDINQLLCNIIGKKGYVPQPAISGTETLINVRGFMVGFFVLPDPTLKLNT
jgi:ActR/RegA family two-component response regulator